MNFSTRFSRLRPSQVSSSLSSPLPAATTPQGFCLDIQRPKSPRLQPHVREDLSLIESIALRDTATGVTQTLHGSVVRPASKLLLHCLTEHGSFHVAICGCLAGELFVEIGGVALVEDGRLERRLVFAVEELAPVDAVEEGVCL